MFFLSVYERKKNSNYFSTHVNRSVKFQPIVIIHQFQAMIFNCHTSFAIESNRESNNEEKQCFRALAYSQVRGKDVEIERSNNKSNKCEEEIQRERLRVRGKIEKGGRNHLSK